MEDATNLFCLKWSNFQKNVSSEFKKIQMDEDLVDITFVVEGESFGAHKLVLFACSPYLKRILKVNPCSHPIFYMNGVKQEVLKAILDYMYLGEVRINQEDLPDFLRVAEEFKIRGVTPDCNTSKQQSSDSSSESNSSIRSNKRPRSAMSNSKVSSNQQTKSTEQQRSDQMFFDHHATPQTPANIELKTEMSDFHEESALTTNEPNSLNQYSESMRSNTSLPLDDGYEGNDNNQSTIDNCNESWIDDEKQHTYSNNSSNSTDNDKNFKSKSNSGKAQCLVPSSCPSCHRVYSNISNLRQHIRLIHNPMSVNCPICNKTFNSNLYLKRHYLSMHSSSNSNSGTTTTTDMKNDNVTTSTAAAAAATISTPSTMNYQDIYAKRSSVPGVQGSIHENLTAGNTTSNVSQQHDMKMNSTWNPYSDLNHEM